MAVYQGVPGAFAGITLSRRAEVTTVPVTALDTAIASRLADGIPVGSLAEAEKLVATYADMAASSAGTATTPSP